MMLDFSPLCGPDCGLAVAAWIIAIIDFLMWPVAALLGWS